MDNAQTLFIPAIALNRNQLRPYYPIGLYSMKAMAREAGYLVDVLELGGGIKELEFESSTEIGSAILSLFEPDKYRIVGLSAIGATFPVTLYLAEEIKRRHPDVLIVMGGPHASFLAKFIMEDFTFVDAVVVGEGEETFVDVLRAGARSPQQLVGIPGVKVRGRAFTSRPFIRNMDDLPVCEMDTELYKRSGIPYIRVEALRGCYCRCKFCATSQFWECKVRRKSPDRLLRELTDISLSTGCNDFLMVGDCFSFPLRALRSTCEHMMQANTPFTWRCALRIDDLTEPDLQIMKQAGCRHIFVGVESASQETLSKISKSIDLPKTLLMIEKALELEIEVSCSHIVGFPWETEKDVMATLKQHRDLLEFGVSSSAILPLIPEPGAEGFSAPIVTDLDSLQRFLPSIYRNDEYALGLIEKHPRHFVNFGHYQTPHLDAGFVHAVTKTAAQISDMIIARHNRARNALP